MMPHIPQAIICGCIGALFSPICFLSLILCGGMAVNIRTSPLKPDLNLKESLQVGTLCGFVAGIFALIFWYLFFAMMQSNFGGFFSSLAGQSLINSTSSLLWQYGLVHFFLSIPLCILGALLSYSMQR